MNTKKICRLFAACLAFGAASSEVYACTSVLAVIRHTEDNDNNPSNLNAEGRAHAEAYTHLFRKDSSRWIGNSNALKNKIPDICEFKKVIAIQTTNPMDTAQLIASGLGLVMGNSSYVDQNTWWGDTGFLQRLYTSGVSTIIVLNRQELWAKKNGKETPDTDAFLINVLRSKKQYKITAAQSPKFSYVYLFTNPNSEHKFDDVDVLIQKYNNNKCYMRLDTGSAKVVIDDLEQMPDEGYPYVQRNWNCETWG